MRCLFVDIQAFMSAPKHFQSGVPITISPYILASIIKSESECGKFTFRDTYMTFLCYMHIIITFYYYYFYYCRHYYNYSLKKARPPPCI